MSMQIPFVGFQPIRTSEHVVAAGETNKRVNKQVNQVQM